MSRPIAYNASGPLSGSIRGGNVNYNVDSGNRDYTTFASKKWVPSADGAAPIVFVTDTYTQGFELNPSLAVPLFYACNGTGSAAIIYTANRIPGSPGNYSDANTALNDLITARGYFILESNDPFEGTYANNMALDVDASKMTSYPQTGTNWYDLSGNGNTGALTNGPTFDSNGWLVFDGVDDYSVGPGTLGSDCTVELWISSSNYNVKIPISIDGANYGSGPNMFFYQNVITWNTGDGGGNPFSNSYYPNAQWHHIVITNDYNVTAKLYIDGKLIGTANPLDATTTGANKFWIGRFHGDNNYTIAARMTAARIYNAALTEAQVKQNYFGSPIVTDGLVFAVDANNIVSYPKSGTSAYNLTGSNELTLQNGLQYRAGNGGYFLSDGTDDALDTPDASNLDIAGNFTVEGWVWWNRHKDYASLLVKGPGGSGNVFNYCFFFYASNIVCGFGDGSAFYSVSISTPTINTWHHIVGTYDGSNLKFYLDGVLTQTSATTATPYQNTSYLNVIQGSYPIDGRVANARVYNRALTAAEVQQNYQAEQYRFETPAGIPTNGLVMNLDASNLESYPGTGTTWYDLTGNGNNVSLINDPTYVGNIFGGYFSNDVDSYFSGAGTGTIPTGNNSYTMLVWARQTVSGGWGDKGFISIGGFGSTNQSNALRTYNNTVGYFAHYWWGNDILLSNNSAGLSLGTWFLAAATFDGTTRRIWINGVSQVSDTPVGHNVASTTIQISKTFGTEYQVGDMAVARIYNRALTSDEMLQTYNVEKSRFGL